MLAGNGEALVCLGAVILAAAVIITVAAAVWLKKYGKRLNNALENDYGKKRI